MGDTVEPLLNFIVGKSGRNDEWLPLWIHGLDTMETMVRLLTDWVSASVNDRIRGKLTDDLLRKLVCFLALVHDIGKITPCFQRKVTAGNAALISELEAEDLRMGEEKEGLPHGAAGEAILIYLGCPVRIASIVGAHHGKPTEKGSEDQDQAKYNVQHNLGDSKSNRAVWQEARKKYLEFALHRSGFESVEEIPSVGLEQQTLLTGLLIMSDWLASNTDFFPLIQAYEMPERSPERFETAWEKIGFPDRWIPELKEMNAEAFDRIFGFMPNGIQEAVLSIVSGMKEPGVIILEAPMGVGKTEAALAAGEVLASRFGSGGLYFGLPTQATANGIFPRLRTWAGDRAGEERHTIRLAHGLAELNEDFARLNTEHANVSEEGLFVHEWFSGRKKVLLSDFVIGTVDQLLMLALKQKHVMLRHLGLAGKVVVIDECHAYDAYMNEYLDRALMWLAAYGVSVILLSATLPAGRRNEIVDAYLSGRGVKPRKAMRAYDAYPLISWTDGDCCYQRQIALEADTRNVNIERISDSELMDVLRKPLQRGAAIGIICNTVRRAQKIREMLTFDGEHEVMLCHAQFLSEDRTDWETKLMRRLGKRSDADDRRGLAVIGTQVLEQSLDIDFDFMVTELCPMDLLLQRIGRLHRHKRIRPEGMETLRCCVLFPTEEDAEAAETIYGKWLLERTTEELPNRICLPDDISPLVQRVYAEPEDKNQKLYLDYVKRNRDQQNRADRFRLGRSEDVPIRRWDYTSLLNGMLDTDIGEDSEEKANAAVRDSISSIEVLVLEKRGETEYRFLPWREGGKRIDAERYPEMELARAISRQRLRLPFVLSAPWNAENTLTMLREQHIAPKAWTESPLLKNELFLFLDEAHSARLGDFALNYSRETGLTTRKVGKDEQGI